MIASLEGLVSLILSTQRHFAKDAPSFLYCAQRSDNPSSPVEDIWRKWLHGRRWTASAVKLMKLTLCGGFSCGSCQGNNTFVYLRWREADVNGGQVDSFKKKKRKSSGWPDLDSHQDVAVSDHFDERDAVVGVLVQCFMEEDDPSEAAVDAVIRSEEDLPELSAVLLRVLHSHLGQALPHAACGGWHYQGVSIRGCWLGVDGQSGDGG